MASTGRHETGAADARGAAPMAGARGAAPTAGVPWISPAGAALALALSVILCWPMLVSGGPMLFSDTFKHLSAGTSMVDILAEVWRQGWAWLSGQTAADGAATLPSQGTPPSQGARIRAVLYPLYLYLGSLTPLGLALPVIGQTAMTLFALLAFLPARPIRPARPARSARPDWPATAAVVLLLGLSTLPWYAIFAISDILAALVVVFYAILMRRCDALRPGQALVLVALATFATASHYGYLPLAAGLAGLVLAWRLVRRRLTWRAVLLGCAPVVLTLSLNALASTATTGTASVAPKRLPILLARSLEDGPAAWYLQQACATRDYTICEVFPEIPTRVGDFLWSDGALGGASRAQIDRIRDEEVEILIAAFRAYPVAQTKALFGNSVRQMGMVGIDSLMPARLRRGYGFTADAMARRDADPVLSAVDRILPLTTLAAALALAWRVARRRLPADLVEATAVVVAGLILNALIFGGLSYPVDRYQSRLVWLLPAILAIALVSRPTPPTGSAPG